MDQKYMLIVLHEDNNPALMFQSKTNEALHLLQKLTKPDSLNLDIDGQGNQAIFLTED